MHRSVVCKYGSTFDNSYSKDKPTVLHQKRFTNRATRARYSSRKKPNSTEIVTCHSDRAQVKDDSRFVVLPPRKVKGKTRYQSVSDNQIFIGIEKSHTVLIYDNEEKPVRSFELKGMEAGLYKNFPFDLTTTTDRLYVCPKYYDKVIAYSHYSGSILTECNTGHHGSALQSIAVNKQLKLIAVLGPQDNVDQKWHQDNLDQQPINFYRVTETKSFLAVNVETDVSRIRISDQGKLWTGKVRLMDIYDLASVFSYSHLKKSLVTTLRRSCCEKVADNFAIGGHEVNTILNSKRPGATFHPVSDERGVIKLSNVDEFEKAFLGLTQSTSLGHAVTMYKRLKGEPMKKKKKVETETDKSEVAPGKSLGPSIAGHEMIIAKLEFELKDGFFSVDKTSLTLNSGVQQRILYTVHLLKMSCGYHVFKIDFFKNILKLLSADTLLKEMCCILPRKPPDSSDELTLGYIAFKDMTVEWHIGYFLQSLDSKTVKWMINIKQPGHNLKEIPEVSADQGSVKYEEEMQNPTTKKFLGTSTESNTHSHTPVTLKQIQRDLSTGVAVPEKKTKVVLEEQALKDITPVIQQTGTVSTGESKAVLEETPVRNVKGRHFKEQELTSYVKQRSCPKEVPVTSAEQWYDQGQTLSAGIGKRLNIEQTLTEYVGQSVSQNVATVNSVAPMFIPGETSSGVTERALCENASPQSTWQGYNPDLGVAPSHVTGSYTSQKTIITKFGGTLEISNTGILLVIPPNALPADKEKHDIHLRYIPRRVVKDEVNCFSSNSTAVVEILPSLTLQHPVRLSLPHCLVLQQKPERKATIFRSHHEEGTHPFWEEQKDVSYHVEDTTCIMLLNSFSWYKYCVNDEIVLAKKMVVYTAAQKVKPHDAVVRIEVGCYPDLPGQEEDIPGGRNIVVAHKKVLHFLKSEKQHPLLISLNGIFPSVWQCRRSSNATDILSKKIPYRKISEDLGNSCAYILEKPGHDACMPLCVFTASQENDVEMNNIAVQLTVNFQVMDRVPWTTRVREHQWKESLKAETVVTKSGGKLEIPGTGVVLTIPPNALKGSSENQFVGMRIIPSRIIGDQVTSISSFSCTAVEMYPQTVSLRFPVELRLPHCLTFEENCDLNAKIFTMYQEGHPARWEIDTKSQYHVDGGACVITLNRLCSVQYCIDDEVVNGQKILMYTAAKELREMDEIAELEVGFHLDIPGGGELLRMNPSFAVDSEQTFLYMREEKRPLQLSLEDLAPSLWECWFPKDNTQDIPIEAIAAFIEHSNLFILKKASNKVGSAICTFTTLPKEGPMSVEISVYVCPQETLFSYRHLSYTQLKESLVTTLGRDDCEKLAHFFVIGREKLNDILNSDTPASNLLLALEEKGIIKPSNVDRLEEAFRLLEMSSSFTNAVNMYQNLRDEITAYDKFLATLSAHLTSPVSTNLCDSFHIPNEERGNILFSQNPGLSLLLFLDEMGVIKPSEVGRLVKPFNKLRLEQALGKVDEYEESVKESNRQFPQRTDSLKETKALFVEFLKKKIKSWYETMTPVPWKKSCQWKSSDLFVGSGLILTDSKAKRNARNIDEKCKLNYTEIFTHEKLKAEIRIILEGDPGSGKTILSSQLAYDWSEGKINGVDVLVYLPLKIVESKTLIQAVKEFYIPPKTPLSENDIESILASDTEKICLLLDGLEEYSTGGLVKAKESSEVMQVMKKEKLSNCKVVITCRSNFVHDLPECPMLKIGRFGETERNSYIEKLSLHNTGKQQKIKQIIQDNPFLLDLCRVPLLFVLAVHNIERINLSEEGQLNKVSPFIRNMILTLCSSITVTHEIDGMQSRLFETEKMTLGELAFNGLCTGHQQLSWQNDFTTRCISNLKDWVDSGILVLEDGSVISEKENQNTPTINKGEEVKEETTMKGRKGTPDELPVLSKDIVTSTMGEVSTIQEKHQSVSHIKAEPHVMKKKTVKRAAGQVPLTVRFLHKVIQEWFAATFFCSMMRRYTSEEKFQNYVSSQLQHISPTDLHYVLRFTSYLYPRSCHVIMNYLLRSYLKDGSVPQYIMNCVFLCFNEHNDVKGPDMRNVVTEVCKEVITIQSEDSRLLQQAKCALLEYASKDGVTIEKLELEDVIFAVNETSLTLNSGVQLGILPTAKLIDVCRWDQVFQTDDYKNVLKLLSAGELLKEVCCTFPSQPPHPLDEITMKNFVSKDIKVEWRIGNVVQFLDLRKDKWEIHFKPPGASSAEISEVSAGQVEKEKQMQQPPSSCLIETSTESSTHSLKNQETQKPTESDSLPETTVSKKDEKVFGKEVLSEDVSQSHQADCYFTQNTIKTEVGGTLQISDTGIMLVIPPNALPAGKEKYTIQLRYIPRRTVKDQSECFSSNSTTIAEILPNLTLQCPARLSLPHCLVLQQNVERKAKILVSHHQKGTQPFWKEQEHVSYHVEDTDCVIMLNSFSWCTYLVDDSIVEAKKLVIYAGARKPTKNDKTVRIEVGCYIDFPEKEKEIQGGQNLVIAHKKILYFLKKKEKYPLQICLNETLRSEWVCTFPSQPEDGSTSFKQEISFEKIASGTGGSCVYLLENINNTVGWPFCIFTVSQEQGNISVDLAVNLQDVDEQPSNGQDMGGHYKWLKEVQETLTAKGKTFELPDTGVVLEIPREAIEDKKFPASVGMRIIPSRKVENEKNPFCSNSSVAVELFPSGVKLRKPAKLCLPHCLVFKETERPKAKIFINHGKGIPSHWKEVKDIKYTVNDNDCIIFLRKLCCVTYAIYNEVVTGKKITVYTATKKATKSKDYAEVEVGYYSDISDGGELLRMNPHFKVDAMEKVLFMENLKSPLQVSLERIGIPKWECIFPKEKQREIPFKTIASSMEHSHLYILQNLNNGDESVHCIFEAWQNNNFREALALTVNQQLQSAASKVELSSEGQASGQNFDADSEYRIIRVLSGQLTKEWRDVCRILGVGESTLFQEESNNQSDIKEAIFKCLLSWNQNRGDDPFFASLCAALEECKRLDLVKYLDKYKELLSIEKTFL